MATVVHPHVETWEFEALQEDKGWCMDIELIAGEAVLVPPIGDRASSAQGELYAALHRWQENTADESVVLEDVFVAIPGGSRLAPDISWWSAERCSSAPPGALQWRMRRSVPDLVVEVLSPSTRANDLGVKRELYMGSGVRELWWTPTHEPSRGCDPTPPRTRCSATARRCAASCWRGSRWMSRVSSRSPRARPTKALDRAADRAVTRV
jgi:Uma2 family endonuclease